MPTQATPHPHQPPSEAPLFVACELREKTWKLGFTTGHGHTPRERSIPARHQERILSEIAQGTRRVKLSETAPVVSSDAAGRDGCWLHRCVQANGITTPVVDSSAIEVRRRRRRATSAGVDVRTLLTMLRRSAQGAHQVWQVVTVPSVAAEDPRHVHRDLEPLPHERASTTTRIKGLCSRQGMRLTSLRTLPQQLDALRLWDGSPLPPGFRQRVVRVYAHHPLLCEQIAEVDATRRERLQSASDTSVAMVRQLM